MYTHMAFVISDPNMACINLPDSRMAFIQTAFLASTAIGCSLAVIDTAGIVQNSHMVCDTARVYTIIIYMHTLLSLPFIRVPASEIAPLTTYSERMFFFILCARMITTQFRM